MRKKLRLCILLLKKLWIQFFDLVFLKESYLGKKIGLRNDSPTMGRGSFLLLMTLIAASETKVYVDSEDALPRNEVPQLIPYEIDEEYIRHISSIMNAYRSDMMGGRLIIETNSQIDTRFKTWKRNADLINSLLALPKGMNDAGR